MTDSNGDLVERVATAIYGQEEWSRMNPDVFRPQCIAAIAAVLDDLANPSAGMLLEGRATLRLRQNKGATIEDAKRTWEEMLGRKVRELARLSPEKPGKQDGTA